MSFRKIKNFPNQFVFTPIPMWYDTLTKLGINIKYNDLDF